MKSSCIKRCLKQIFIASICEVCDVKLKKKISTVNMSIRVSLLVSLSSFENFQPPNLFSPLRHNILAIK